MAKHPWNSYKTLVELRKRMSELLQEGLSEFEMFSDMTSGISSWTPPVDVIETEDSVVLYGELPGVSKKHIEVQLKGNELLLSGDRKPQSKTDASSFHLAERYYGPFARTFKLPDQIDDKKIKTSLNDGVLEIVLPKRKPRKIPIN